MSTIIVGNQVCRKSKGYESITGTVIEIDNIRGRARVQWTENLTWYNLSSLVKISSGSDDNPQV